MEFHIQKSKLQDEIGRLSGIVEKKSPIPILEHALIQSNGMSIKLAATDLDITMFTECPVDFMSGEGSLCVPARKLFDIVRVLPDGPIKIISDSNDWIRIQASGSGRASNFRLPGAGAGQFPELQKMPAEHEWTNVSAKSFKQVLKGVAFAVSTNDDNRYALNGVKVEIGETDIRMIATDGHRLSLASGALDDLMFTTINTLIPSKGVSELSKLLSDYDGPVGVWLAQNGIYFRLHQRTLYTRLLTGKFPTYKPFLDTIYTSQAVFEANALGLALKRTMQVVDEKGDGVVIAFKDGKVSFHGQNADVGECYEVMESNFNGGELRIVCNPRYMLDFLDQMGNEKVEVNTKDAKTQILLRCVKDKIDYKYFLMLMRDKGAA